MGKYLHPLCTMKNVEVPVIGIDFDGTIASQVTYQGPGIFGPPIPGAAAAIHYLKSLGYMIAIYTARGESSYPYMIDYMQKNNIQYDFINENPFTKLFDPNDCNACKPNFDLYIDDKNIRFDGNWRSIVTRMPKLMYPYWMKGR